jgi:outer membrane putative beta-barrel porin/alpha-amylase
MTRSFMIALALAVSLIATPAIAVDSASQLFPVLLDRLTAPLGLPPSPPAPELLEFQRALRVPFIKGPESPSQSFSFRFDPSVGALTPSVSGFGSLYTNRPDTIGKGHFSFGLTYSHAEFEHIDGADLDKLQISLGGGLVARLQTEVVLDVVDLKGTFGLLEDLDIDLAIPILRQFIAVNGSLDTPLGTMNNRVSRDVLQVGDIALGAKYRFYKSDPLDFAARLEVFFPTGSVDDFTGTDVFQVNPSIIAAIHLPFGFIPHATLGFRFSSDVDKLNHQFFYAAGLEKAIGRIVSVGVDVLGTHVIDNDRPAVSERAGVGFSLKRSSSDILDLGVSLKANPWRNVLVNLGVFIPLNRTGIRAPVIPSIGAEVPF